MPDDAFDSFRKKLAARRAAASSRPAPEVEPPPGDSPERQKQDAARNRLASLKKRATSAPSGRKERASPRPGESFEDYQRRLQDEQIRQRGREAMEREVEVQGLDPARKAAERGELIPADELGVERLPAINDDRFARVDQDRMAGSHLDADGHRPEGFERGRSRRRDAQELVRQEGPIRPPGGFTRNRARRKSERELAFEDDEGMLHRPEGFDSGRAERSGPAEAGWEEKARKKKQRFRRYEF